MPSANKILAKIPINLQQLPAIDHRIIGLRQKLFFFSELSQGSCFFKPRGAHIYNKLVDYLRAEYKKRNYEEVITPNIYDCQLWKTSGHWEHYEHNMIKFQLSERDYSLKPMNCPGHCLMYKHLGTITSDQLPLRWADFGVLHRNELSGSILGLTRVRRFQQDDAHIFCTPQQVESEIRNCLQFTQKVYSDFGFDFELRLSSRPKSYLGESSMWDKAEESLRDALAGSEVKFDEQKLEGAFYGPKIDLVVKDCLQRSQQCATIQLDFQLPERFDLTYKATTNPDALSESTLNRPVIIHRAILGSIERFIGMIAENCAGRWPFWLSPLQALVVPIHPNLNQFAKLVSDEFRKHGFWVDCNETPGVTFNRKIREALLTPYSVILIVGQREVDTRSVTIRIQSSGSEGKPSLSADDDDDDVHDHQKIKDSSRVDKEKKVVHNINIGIDRLIELFKEFEKCRVNRADLELLKLFKACDGNKS